MHRVSSEIKTPDIGIPVRYGYIILSGISAIPVNEKKRLSAGKRLDRLLA
jgi:hypothetical protein